MSDSGDYSTVDKKREYNRNAQRVFRQRRKEHLKNLEAAERQRTTAQSEELERLRHENAELRLENESLQRLYGLASSSPAPPPTSSPPKMSRHHFVGYPAGLSVLGGPSPLLSQPDSIDDTPELIPKPSFCVIAPYSIPEIRSYLQTLFHSILDIGVYTDPPSHLAMLASLGPSLPLQLQPTELQLATPHHVYIDLIPFPGLRDVLIEAGASTASAFLNEACAFACDIEDQGQVVVWGDDFLNEFSWEFSAVVLEKWGGWLLPSVWRDRANFWRRQRGDPLLPTWNG